MEIVINRFKGDKKQTLGELLINGKVFCKTLELAWNDNNKRISCIPRGKYKVTKRYSAKYGRHFWVRDVPNRDMILIHSGNYHFQINGCILVGDKHKDLNYDGYLDVENSKKTLSKLYDTTGNEFILYIQ